MENIVKEYLKQLKIGHKQVYKNLALYPLLSSYTIKADYLTLDEALAAGVVEVMEVSKEDSVPEL